MRTINTPSVRAVGIPIAVCAGVLGLLVAFSKFGLPRFRDADFGHLHDRPWWFATNNASSQDEVESTYVLADGTKWEFEHKRDGRKYGLDDDQCMVAFPDLYEEIDRAVEYRRKVGNITLTDIEGGMSSDNVVRAMIRNNELYIIDAQGASDGDHQARSLASLHSLNRAITNGPGRLPNIEFALLDQNSPLSAATNDLAVWSYARLSQQESLWLIPDFGFWSWPEIGLRSYPELLSILDDSEDDFLDKSPELVWRASPKSEESNSRESLIRQSKGQSWANIKEVDWSNETSVDENNLSLQDHCNYMFLAQTEGNTYASRLKYLLNCHSVVVTHELQWIEHYHHLLSSSGKDQNFIKLSRDFSELRSTMSKAVETSWQQDQGLRIANNAQRTFRERYLTPAAEACYWRALIRGWASVQGFQPAMWLEDKDGGAGRNVSGASGEKRRPRGTPFEMYAITGAVD